MKLKNKFAIIMVFNIIIPMFLLSAISINMFSKNLLEQNKSFVKMINSSFYNQFLEFERSAENTLSNFSSQNILESAVGDNKELAKKSIESIKNESFNLMKNSPHIKNVTLQDDKGNILINYFIDLDQDILQSDFFYNPKTDSYLKLLKKTFKGGQLIFFIDINTFVSNTLSDLELDEGIHLYIIDKASRSIILHNKFGRIASGDLRDESFFNEALNLRTGFMEYSYMNDSKIAYIKEYNGQIFGVSLSKAAIFSIIQHIKNIIYAFMIVFVVLAIIVSFAFSKYLTTPMLKFSNNLKKLSEGIISEKLYINTRDEIEDIAKNYNKFSEKLKDILIEIREGATLIATSTNNMRGAHKKLAAKSSDQAAEIRHTTTNINEISSIVLSNTQKTMEASKITASTEKKTEEVGSMSIELKNSIDRINESSLKIKNIIEVIDEIAFQTNLLALNAAVEAANTGEEGRGFAVVAAEVRNLSKRSIKSANEIKSLVEENVSIVNDGSKIVNATINDINEIVDDVKKVNEVISNLANSVKEQQEGIEHINNAIEKLNEVTRMNAWIAEETSSSTDILYEKSNKFLNLIDFFQFAKK